MEPEQSYLNGYYWAIIDYSYCYSPRCKKYKDKRQILPPKNRRMYDIYGFVIGNWQHDDDDDDDDDEETKSPIGFMDTRAILERLLLTRRDLKDIRDLHAFSWSMFGAH